MLFNAVIKTAPAATSFIIFAFSLYSSVIKSIVVSIAVFINSANNTKNIVMLKISHSNNEILNTNPNITASIPNIN